MVRPAGMRTRRRLRPRGGAPVGPGTELLRGVCHAKGCGAGGAVLAAQRVEAELSGATRAGPRQRQLAERALPPKPEHAPGVFHHADDHTAHPLPVWHIHGGHLHGVQRGAALGATRVSQLVLLGGSRGVPVHRLRLVTPDFAHAVGSIRRVVLHDVPGAGAERPRFAVQHRQAFPALLLRVGVRQHSDGGCHGRRADGVRGGPDGLEQHELLPAAAPRAGLTDFQ